MWTFCQPPSDSRRLHTGRPGQAQNHPPCASPLNRATKCDLTVLWRETDQTSHSDHIVCLAELAVMPPEHVW